VITDFVYLKKKGCFFAVQYIPGIHHHCVTPVEVKEKA